MTESKEVDKPQGDSSHVDSIVRCRNEKHHIIRRLWASLNKTLELEGVKKLSDEDLDLWILVTAHTAIQEKLENKGY